MTALGPIVIPHGRSGLNQSRRRRGHRFECRLSNQWFEQIERQMSRGKQILADGIHIVGKIARKHSSQM